MIGCSCVRMVLSGYDRRTSDLSNAPLPIKQDTISTVKHHFNAQLTLSFLTNSSFSVCTERTACA